MIERIIEYSVRNPLVVILLAFFLGLRRGKRTRTVVEIRRL